MDLRRKKLERASNVNFTNLSNGDVLVYNSFTNKWENALVGGTVTVAVANYSSLPSANTVSGKFYWCQSSQGTKWLPGSLEAHIIQQVCITQTELPGSLWTVQ
jgi:hypothetical protein